VSKTPNQTVEICVSIQTKAKPEGNETVHNLNILNRKLQRTFMVHGNASSLDEQSRWEVFERLFERLLGQN
jgi:hypothetical protein